MILGSRRGERREREEDNEVEVNDITVYLKGEGRRRVESGGSRLEKESAQGEVGRWGS